MAQHKALETLGIIFDSLPEPIDGTGTHFILSVLDFTTYEDFVLTFNFIIDITNRERINIINKFFINTFISDRELIRDFLDFIIYDNVNRYSMALMLQFLAELLNCNITINQVNFDNTAGNIIFRPNYFLNKRPSPPINIEIDIAQLQEFLEVNEHNMFGLHLDVPTFNMYPAQLDPRIEGLLVQEEIHMDPTNIAQLEEIQGDPRPIHLPHNFVNNVDTDDTIDNVDINFNDELDEQLNQIRREDPQMHVIINDEHENNADPNARQHGGFKKKYLKYKTKYLNLLKQLKQQNLL
jgi:hypothetical protein